MAEKQRGRIFLVDSDENHTFMLRDSIGKKYDFEIITFNNGEDCVKNLHLNPSFIILGYHLNQEKKEVMSGIEVLKQIKMILPGVFVIMLSQEDESETAVNSIKYGAYDYVIKNSSSSIRIENILKNITNNIALKRKADWYKKVSVILLVICILLIAAMVILIKSGGQ